MAPLPLSLCRRLCSCQASIVALIACCQAGDVALVMMALLLLMRRHICHCCNCSCRPHDNGAVTVVDAQGSLPLMRWHCCPCNNGIVALITMVLLSLIHNGLVVLAMMELLPSSSWCHCPHCNGVVVIMDAQVSLPSLQWHHCPCHYSIVAFDAQVSLPLLQL
jgi:hypothetical protein